MSELTSPYKPPYHKISVKLSLHDFSYISDLLPISHGKFDAILATLFADFCDTLRRAFPEPLSPVVRAWEPSHATLWIVRELLSSSCFDLPGVLQRCAAGRTPRDAAPRDDERASAGLHQGDGTDEDECAIEEGEAQLGGDGKRAQAEKDWLLKAERINGSAEIAGDEASLMKLLSLLQPIPKSNET